MKILYLAVSKFKSNKFLRILIILQVIYAFFTFNFVVSRWYSDTKLDRAFSKSNFSETLLHVSPLGDLIGVVDPDTCFNDIKIRLEHIGNVISINKIKESGELVYADHNYWDIVGLSLYKGEYFDSTPLEDELTCIISYDMKDVYNIGDIYYIHDLPIARIIGVAQKETWYLSFLNGGSLVDLNDILVEANNKVFICDDVSNQYSFTYGFYIIVDENADFESVYSQCKYALRNVADVYTYDELRAKSRDYNYEVINLMNTLFIVTLVICLFGITACNLLLTLNDRSIFSLYYVCGFSWKKSLLLTAVQNIVSLVIPVLLGMLVYLFVAAGMSATNFETSILNWVGSFGLMFAIFIATSIIPVLTLRKLSPMEFIRKF